MLCIQDNSTCASNCAMLVLSECHYNSAKETSMHFAFEVLVSLQLANYSLLRFCNSSFTADSLSFEGKRVLQIEVNWGLNSIAPIRRIH